MAAIHGPCFYGKGEVMKQINTWCPECGPDVTIDENGCCVSCGSNATGLSVDRIYYLLETNKKIMEMLNQTIKKEFQIQTKHIYESKHQGPCCVVEKIKDKDDFICDFPFADHSGTRKHLNKKGEIIFNEFNIIDNFKYELTGREYKLKSKEVK